MRIAAARRRGPQPIGALGRRAPRLRSPAGRARSLGRPAPFLSRRLPVGPGRAAHASTSPTGGSAASRTTGRDRRRAARGGGSSSPCSGGSGGRRSRSGGCGRSRPIAAATTPRWLPTTPPASTAASSAARRAGRCTPTARRSTSTRSRIRTSAARPCRRLRPCLSRPQPRPPGDGGPRRRARARLRGGRVEMGRLLRRLSALLDHRPMTDPLRPLWDFDDLDATEARFRALRAEALTQLARVQGLRERLRRAATDCSTRSIEDDPRVRVRVDLERGRLRRSSATRRPRCRSSSAPSPRRSKRGRTGSPATPRTCAALAAPDRDGFVAWTNRGLELAERPPAASYWAGPLLNNLGWEHFDAERVRAGARRLRAGARGARAAIRTTRPRSSTRARRSPRRAKALGRD